MEASSHDKHKASAQGEAIPQEIERNGGSNLYLGGDIPGSSADYLVFASGPGIVEIRRTQEGIDARLSSFRQALKDGFPCFVNKRFPPW